MAGPVIETPRGSIVVNSATMKAELVWDPAFQPDRQEHFSRAQMFVDSEILRLCEPFTPLRTGMLVTSGTLGTTVGEGVVSWIAPYSKAQYYGGREEGESQTGKLRGRYWFERMKEVWEKTIIAGARALAGGKR